MNSEQKKAFDAISSGKNIFLTGSAGVGKTFIIKKFVEKYKFIKKIGITSTTGISAILLGGTTLHSYLGIGLGEDKVENLFYKITRNGRSKKNWTATNVLIIDEVSMLKPELFEKLELLGRMLRNNILPFGGIQIILSGDFLQLPCIKSEKFVFESEMWPKVIKEVHYLKTIVRQSESTFINVLEKIRLGKIDEEVKEVLDSRIGQKLTNDFNILPTQLYCKNVNVDRINNQNLEKLIEETGEVYEYSMEFNFEKDLSLEVLQKYKKNLNIPETLSLCKNCQVMLTYNLDISNELVNGSRGIVIDFMEDFPIVQFYNGNVRKITHITTEIEENDKLIMSYTYLPLRLAWSISCHKCQGSTLDLVEVDLGDLFEYGQGYVALSRVKSLEGLSIKKIDYDYIMAHPKALEFYAKLEG